MTPFITIAGGLTYFLFSPRKLGKWSNLTNTIFQMGGSTTNSRISSFFVGDGNPYYKYDSIPISRRKGRDVWCFTFAILDQQFLSCSPWSLFSPFKKRFPLYIWAKRHDGISSISKNLAHPGSAHAIPFIAQRIIVSIASGVWAAQRYFPPTSRIGIPGKWWITMVIDFVP